MSKLLHVAVLILLWGASSVMAAAATVTIANGQLRASTDDGVSAFKGIAFAAPPMGALRWQAPQPATAWKGIQDASEYGAACFQLPFTKGSPYYRPAEKMSEDCLYLNVWTPDLKPQKAAPVMVWIHGGSFTRGSGSTGQYEGSSFARDGVVLVTINYRLNIFGYLAHPELSAEQGGSSGNYGLQDQIAALAWVKENIAAFGGDPERVTIFGESAGSMAVNQLLASPLAAGLFHRAIGQSGGYLSPQAVLSKGHDVGLEVAASVGAKNIAALRALKSEQVLQVFSEIEASGKRIRPLVDGRVIPEQAFKLFEAGKYNRVPSLVGYNKDESSVFALAPSVPFLYKKQGDFEKGLKDFAGPAAQFFIDAYPEERGSIQPYLDFWRDLIFGWNMHTWARLNEKAGEQSYLYFFTHAPNNGFGKALGAFHASEIGYVFGNGVGESAEDRKVHELMRAYWVNFARGGDPNGKGLPAWPRYGSEQSFLELNASPTQGRKLHEKQMQLWSAAYGAISSRAAGVGDK